MNVVDDDRTRAYGRDGFVVLRGVVPPDLLATIAEGVEAPHECGVERSRGLGDIHSTM